MEMDKRTTARRRGEGQRKEGRKTEWETLTVVAENTQRKRRLHLRKQSDKKMRRHRGLRGDRDRRGGDRHVKTDTEDKSRADVRENTTAKPVHTSTQSVQTQ